MLPLVTLSTPNNYDAAFPCNKAGNVGRSRLVRLPVVARLCVSDRVPMAAGHRFTLMTSGFCFRLRVDRDVCRMLDQIPTRSPDKLAYQNHRFDSRFTFPLRPALLPGTSKGCRSTGRFHNLSYSGRSRPDLRRIGSFWSISGEATYSRTTGQQTPLRATIPVSSYGVGCRLTDASFANWPLPLLRGGLFYLYVIRYCANSG